MSSCRICLRDFKKLRFQTERIAICTRCVNTLNDTPESASSAIARWAEKLAIGMRRNAERDLQADEEWKRKKAKLILEDMDAAVASKLHDWITRLLKDPKNSTRDFNIMRAHRRGLLRLNDGASWDYPSDWIERAHRIRNLDGCCADCGATGVMLDVHHIVYLSNWGTNRQENLVTLCRACHEKEHGRVFDIGESQEPGNPDPIRLPPPLSHVERPASAPALTRVGDKLVQVQPVSDARIPANPPPDPPHAKTELAPERIEPKVDLRCPTCLKELTIPARFAASWKIIRCPVCTVSFDFERTRREAPKQEVPVTPPAVSTPSPAAHRIEADVEPPIERKASHSHAKILRTDLVFLLALAFLLGYIGYSNLQHKDAPELPPQRFAGADPALEERQLRMLMDDAMRRWPYLNTADGVEATREMIQVRNRLIANGTPPVEALRLSIEQVAPKYAR